MGFIDTEEHTKADLRVDEGDHERHSHYVEKGAATEAAIMGTPVIALCGKVWVPYRDPKKFPICPTCKEIFEALFLDKE